jgi:hypothetical protein
MLKIRYSAMRRVLLGLVALTVTAGPANVGAATLRWKFKPGETLRYAMEQKTVTTLKVPGQQLETTLTQTIDLSWVVKDVAADGTADVSWTIDRMRTRIESAIGAFAYDSKDEKVPEGPVATALVPTLKALVGTPFPFKVNPQGELSDVQVPEKVTQVLRDAGQAASGANTPFSEEGLKNMITQSSLALPADDFSVGETWSKQTKVPSPPIGTMTLDTTFTYLGPDPKAANIEKIGLATKLGVEPQPDGDVKLVINSQVAKGEFSFDNAAKRVVNSEVAEKTDTTITYMDMNIQRIVDTKTTMKLVPGEASKPSS